MALRDNYDCVFGSGGTRDGYNLFENPFGVSLRSGYDGFLARASRMSMTYRTSTLAQLQGIGTVNTTGTQGGWAVDDDASTPSGSTGPGTNSAGPYVFSESSASGTPDVIRTRSAIAFDMSLFGAAKSRRLRLQICGQGHFSEDTEELRVNFKNAPADAWAVLARQNGWPYSNNHDAGDTITNVYHSGPDVTCVRDGGWIDWWVDIPDAVTDLQYQTYPVAGSLHQHDVALWEVEFSWIG